MMPQVIEVNGKKFGLLLIQDKKPSRNLLSEYGRIEVVAIPRDCHGTACLAMTDGKFAIYFRSYYAEAHSKEVN